MAKAERILSPQQELFLASYTNPKSATFGNALQSGLKAGYSQEYSENITGQLPEWLSENLGRAKMVTRAEKNLIEVQEIDITDDQGKPDHQLIDKRTKVDFFVLERLNKKDYSTRTEMTGADGKDLPTPILLNVTTEDAISSDNSNPEDTKTE